MTDRNKNNELSRFKLTGNSLPPLFKFNSVTLKYQVRPIPVIENLNMVAGNGGQHGRFIAIVGPSGCGKSTILRLMAGLLAPNSGEIQVLGQPVLAPSGKRGMVFQNYTSFDWLTVLENVRFPLTLKNVEIKTANRIALKYLEMVGLTDYTSYYPKHLSGGMRQRVAIARSLVNEPDVLLMDEPFGALDHFTREDMQDNLIKTWRKLQNNIVFVTHDINEAVFLGDEVYVMTTKPMKVYKKHRIEFNYENRNRNLKYETEFVQHVKQIQDEIRFIMSENSRKYEDSQDTF